MFKVHFRAKEGGKKGRKEERAGVFQAWPCDASQCEAAECVRVADDEEASPASAQDEDEDGEHVQIHSEGGAELLN